MTDQISKLSGKEALRIAAWNRTNLTRRRWLAVAAAAGGAALGHVPAFARQATPEATPLAAGRDWQSEHWVGSWAAGLHIPSPGFGDEFPTQIFELGGKTLRQIVRLSTGGDQVRIRLANTFGDAPIAIGAASVAFRDHDEVIDPASARELTFSGLPDVTIPAGAVIVSDPVEMSIPNLAELTVDLYFPEATTGSTVHGFSFQTNYLSSAGDHTMEEVFPVETAMQTWVFLTGVDVAVPQPSGAIVALGDSITDGAFSTPDTNHRWPDLLAERLAASSESMPGVLNQGIGGNRILSDPPAEFPFFGPNALARFDREVLAMPGATHLIVFEGINDIGAPVTPDDPAQPVTADQLIAGLRQLAERAHEHGLMVYGATITPCEGANYISARGEAVRIAVNDWIRSGGAFDAVFDFDAVVRDPDHPTQLLPAFNGGDHLHLNDAGFQAMAESIDLGQFETA